MQFCIYITATRSQDVRIYLYAEMWIMQRERRRQTELTVETARKMLESSGGEQRGSIAIHPQRRDRL